MVTTYAVIASHEDEVILAYAGTDKKNAIAAGEAYVKRSGDDLLEVGLYKYSSGEKEGELERKFSLADEDDR